ncbi:MAG: type II toxin-antitoxin system VapC family toxin [Chloroflexota bacterium]
MKGLDLESAIPPGATILIDTSVALAYLTGTELASPAAEQLFDAFVATGRNAAALSVVTVGEILVRPFKAGPSAVATAEGFLRHFGEIRLLDVTYDVAREAARIRAATGLRMPDALVIASALISEVEIVVTNDRAWTAAMTPIAPEISFCTLEAR